MGQILFAGEESHVRAPLLRDVVPQSAAQHRVLRFECVEDRAYCCPALDLNLYLAAGLRQRAQVCREHDSDHGRVCTSTESTAGRSRTMGAQLSPESGDAYTCPPVVPK